jgi:hypothetical protein
MARSRVKAYDPGVAVQPHAQLYRGLPPVVRHPWGRRLVAGGVLATAGSVVALALIALVRLLNAPPPRGSGFYTWYELTGLGISIVAVPLVVGGVLGVAFVRGWRSMLAVDAVLFAVAFWVFSIPFFALLAWLLVVFGVSAGLGVRRLLHRRRVLRASFVGHPA